VSGVGDPIGDPGTICAKHTVLIIMLMHAATNAVSGNFFGTMFTGADARADLNNSSAQAGPSVSDRSVQSPQSPPRPSMHSSAYTGPVAGAGPPSRQLAFALFCAPAASAEPVPFCALVLPA
jgi:hypothetical protein